MFKIIKNIVCFITISITFVSSVPCVELDDLDLHLKAYAEINHTHHDNIADNYHTHTHTHKHSEDGEEHEHHHEHLKIQVSDIKIIFYSAIKKQTVSITEPINGFYEKSFVSTAHPNKILRPPIS